ncbi:unnamed protein product [Durusdinium trenchii]|uniref:RING-type domain-containing protein n=1 Tax=Durusdinium trenchii TaxID=1381693 RepID=A0ABP0NLI9_9DINO
MSHAKKCTTTTGLPPRSSSAFGGKEVWHSSGSGLIIVNVENSYAVRNWNKENPHLPIEVGQAILEVNGIRNSKRMLEEFRVTGQADLLIATELTQQQNAIYERSLVLERRTLEVQNLLIPVDETFDPAEPCSICQDNLLTSEPADSGAEKTKEGSLQAPSGLSCAKVVVRLRCNHYFHSTCIKAWLVFYSSRCPLCNAIEMT